MTHAIANKEETRKLREIVEIVNVNSDGTAIISTPFSWDASTDKFFFKRSSKVFEKITKRYGMTMEDLETDFRRKIQVLYRMYKKGIFKFEEVQAVVNKYYKRPQEVLREFEVI